MIKRIVGAVSLAVVIAGAAYAAEPQFISIGTGGVTGVYYPTGGAICRLVNKNRKSHGIRCKTETTSGSIYNISAIRDGKFEFGVAQSDWHHHAYHGTSAFQASGKFGKLRSVFSVHGELVTIIARDDSGIANITDFKGKRINIGNEGSGTLATYEVIEKAMGWTRGDLAHAEQLKSAETSAALCAGEIDAYFWLVGHPSALTQESLASCATHLVGAASPEINKLIADNPYYRSAKIPAGLYNNGSDISTFGVGATIVTSSDVPDDIVYTVVKAVFENFDAFKNLHPAFAHLTEKEMISDDLSAPLHDGALKYYRERGWK